MAIYAILALVMTGFDREGWSAIASQGDSTSLVRGNDHKCQEHLCSGLRHGRLMAVQVKVSNGQTNDHVCPSTFPESEAAGEGRSGMRPA